MNISEGGLEEADVNALLNGHLQGMAGHSPPESIHALDIEGLKASDITFWTLRDGDERLGCIALKQLEGAHALYDKFGFVQCGPFGYYDDDPFSRFRTIEL